MKLNRVRMDELVLPDYRQKKPDDRMMERLKSSIGEFGYVVPLVVNTENNHVVSGIERYMALQELGYEEVDAVMVTIKAIEKEETLAVALNRISFDWDTEKLRSLLEEINRSPVDFLKRSGFSEEELRAFELPAEKKEFSPGKHSIISEASRFRGMKQTDIKPGDLFQLGKHRLICGSCMDPDILSALMADEKADMIFTDPPYDFTDWITEHILDEYIETGHVFMMYDDEHIVSYLKESRFRFEEFFVADIGFATMINNRSYLRHILISHETAGNPMEVVDPPFQSILKMKYRAVLEGEKVSHPHQKSIEFVEQFVSVYPGETVLDPFGGSGTTLLACETAGRSCRMVELEPHYVQLIIDRWEEKTGLKAVRIR